MNERMKQRYIEGPPHRGQHFFLVCGTTGLLKFFLLHCIFWFFFCHHVLSCTLKKKDDCHLEKGENHNERKSTIGCAHILLVNLKMAREGGDSFLWVTAYSHIRDLVLPSVKWDSSCQDFASL